ncbi:hypothetical protein N656DRAFT_840443 [Canariomyces notabilis]|uniref:Protein kinase domain-containing protein n=1 Tax=Canariomyces notabilis TaxID=2074819 RepID=A0AAN6QFN9_9PEZI|nr:hypothetical protein N656DRAFT_840443 [Canariomyces arenarius]
MSAELILAIVGVAGGCIQLANQALSTCKAYRDAPADLEKKIVIVESIWPKVQAQLQVVCQMSDQGLWNDELADCHFALLQQLHGTLLQAVSRLEMAASAMESQDKSSNIFRKFGRWKYALANKALNALMTELEAWQSRFDPSWYLIARIASKVLDPVLAESWRDREQVSNSNSNARPLENMLALRKALQEQDEGTAQDPRTLYLEVTQIVPVKELTMDFTSTKAIPVDISLGTSRQGIADVESLARRLQHIEPDTFGLLRCEGLLGLTEPQNRRLTSLDVVYRAPRCKQPPITLRQLLLNQQEVSLTAVVNLAKQLVTSVSYIHACDFVHKNIRPENVILFPPSTNPRNPIGTAYLLGCTHFRSITHETNLYGDSAWHRNLYRHPARQGLEIFNEYIMQHDIYSLGVCLLEIGLWKSFVSYQSLDSGNTRLNGDMDWENEDCLQLSMPLTDRVFERVHLNKGGTLWVKEGLVAMSRELLPARMGEMYTDIVVSCLTCLDEGNDDFAGLEENGGDDGITVGVRFVEKILARVGEIRL